MSNVSSPVPANSDKKTHASSTTTPPDAPKKDRKKPERRVRPESEAALSKVLNLIARLAPEDQRKVMAAVQALIGATTPA